MDKLILLLLLIFGICMFLLNPLLGVIFLLIAFIIFKK